MNRQNVGIKKMRKPQEFKTQETRIVVVWIAGNIQV
jgi:hypothetical protein